MKKVLTFGRLTKLAGRTHKAKSCVWDPVWAEVEGKLPLCDCVRGENM